MSKLNHFFFAPTRIFNSRVHTGDNAAILNSEFCIPQF